MYNRHDVNSLGVFSPPGSINIDDPQIRFINSQYKELFRIPDGGSVRVSNADGEVREHVCRYIDDYHVMVGSNVFHICQFAECMERIHATYEPVEASR